MEELQQYLNILQRRLVPSLIVFAGTIGLTYYNVIQQTPLYQAYGQLIYKKNTTSALTGVGVQIGQIGTSVYGSPLKNQAAMLTSITMADKTMKHLAKNKPHIKTSISEILQNLSVNNLDGSDIMNISFRDSEAKKAADIVNAVMEAYTQKDLEDTKAQTSTARMFIEKQIPLVEKRLKKVESDLRQMKETHAVIDVSAEIATISENIKQVNGELTQSYAKLHSLNARIQSYQNIFGKTPMQMTVSALTSESPRTTALVTQLKNVQQKIEVERLRFQEQHPLIINLRKTEAILQSQIDQESRQAFLGTDERYQKLKGSQVQDLSPGGIQQGLISSYAQAETERSGTAQQIQVLQQVAESLRKRAMLLPKLEQQQRELERQQKIYQASYEAFQARLQEMRLSEQQILSNVEIITRADTPIIPLATKQMTSWIQGGIMAIVLGVGTALLLEKMDKRINSPEAAKDMFGYSWLGMIPVFSPGGSKSKSPELVVRDEPDSPASEAFRMLQANLRFLNSDKKLKIIVITSSVPKEGKSTISANLALANAQIGRKVLLIDGDLRRPTQHLIWEQENQQGLSHILTGQVALDDVKKEVEPNLYLVTAGQKPLNPAATLDSSHMGVLIGQATKEYDFVIVDAPPLSAAADATILGKMTDGILLIVRPGVADSSSITFSKEMLAQSNQNVLGLVISAVEKKTSGYRYYYTGYPGHTTKV